MAKIGEVYSLNRGEKNFRLPDANELVTVLSSGPATVYSDGIFGKPLRIEVARYNKIVNCFESEETNEVLEVFSPLYVSLGKCD